MNAAPKEYKIVLFGIGGVGKSALTLQFIRNTFVEEYDPTIEDSYTKEILLDNVMCKLDILDTAGQEEYNLMHDQYIRKGQGFLIVYSVDNLDSLLECKKMVDKIKVIKESDFVPSVLVANKTDIVLRQVSTQKGLEFAKQLNLPLIETSAKFSINVREAFFELVRQINIYRLRRPQNLIQNKVNRNSVKPNREFEIVSCCSII